MIKQGDIVLVGWQRDENNDRSYELRQRSQSENWDVVQLKNIVVTTQLFTLRSRTFSYKHQSDCLFLSEFKVLWASKDYWKHACFDMHLFVAISLSKFVTLHFEIEDLKILSNGLLFLNKSFF